MKTNIDLYWICLNSHCHSLFKTTSVEISMTALAMAMIIDGSY